MKLWLISQDVNNNYDTYDSAVVAAESAEEARAINPDGKWGASYTGWAAAPEQVEVTYIGEAAENIPTGILLSSFNAG